jgi:hypothetical protein
MKRQRKGVKAGSDKFARTIAAAVPIATPPDPSFGLHFEWLAARQKARYGCTVRNLRDVEKTPKNNTSRAAEIEAGRGKTPLGVGPT